MPAAIRAPEPHPAAVDERSLTLANRLRPALLHLARHLRREVQTESVTAGQVEILALVDHRPGLGINELASLMSISAPSMSNAIDKLEAAGLAIRRREEPGDRRRVGISVTAAGARVTRWARSNRTAWLAERLSQLSPEHLAALEAAADALDAIPGGPELG